MLLRLVCRPRVSGCACPYTATAVDPEVSSFCPCSRMILCKVENSKLKSFSPSAVRLSGHSLLAPAKVSVDTPTLICRKSAFSSGCFREIFSRFFAFRRL